MEELLKNFKSIIYMKKALDMLDKLKIAIITITVINLLIEIFKIMTGSKIKPNKNIKKILGK